MAIIPNLEGTEVNYTANICNPGIVLLCFHSRSHTAKIAVLEISEYILRPESSPSVIVLKLFLNRKREFKRATASLGSAAHFRDDKQDRC